MNSLLVLVAASSVGVDYGWQPTQGGEVEYIIQIEPSLLDSLRAGAEITSRIDPRVRGVRRFRIRVGNQSLPRIGQTKSPAAPENRAPDKVADDQSGAPDSTGVNLNATIPPSKSGSDADLERGSRLQPPKLVTPGSVNAGNAGGEFRLDGDLPGGSLPSSRERENDTLLPLRDPSDSSEDAPIKNGPTPIPDPDSASRRPKLESEGSQLADQPRKLNLALASEPLDGSQASFEEVVAEKKSTEDRSPSNIPVVGEEASKRPWRTLILISLLLFGSIGLNLYLGWIARGIYIRYRTLVLESNRNGAAIA